jgi:hypothetical protein
MRRRMQWNPFWLFATGTDREDSHLKGVTLYMDQGIIQRKGWFLFDLDTALLSLRYPVGPVVSH